MKTKSLICIIGESNSTTTLLRGHITIFDFQNILATKIT